MSFVPESYLFPEDDPKEYDVKLREYLKMLATAINNNAETSKTEDKIYKKTFDFGILPKVERGSKTVEIPHVIDLTKFYILKIQGAFTSQGDPSYPYPYAHPIPNENIRLEMLMEVIRMRVTYNISTTAHAFLVVEYFPIK